MKKRLLTLISNKAIYLLFIAFCLTISCKLTEEEKIKETCNTFIEGRVALRNGDSSILKAVSDDSLFMLLMLNTQYSNMNDKDVPTYRADLNIKPTKVEITGNCATCLMSGEEFYKINLCKEEDKWKVIGENDVYPTSNLIAEALLKIENLKKYIKQKPAVDSVLNFVNPFYEQVKLYFKTGELGLLEKNYNNSTSKFLENLYWYVKKRGDLDMIDKEMNEYDYTPGEVIFETNEILYKLYIEKGEMTLYKNNNNYLITKINGIDIKLLTEKMIDKEYWKILRTLRIISKKKLLEKTS